MTLHRKRPREAGNVMAILFVVIGFMGIISFAVSNLLGSPLTAMYGFSNQAVAQAQLELASQLLVLDAVNRADQGDCDSDLYIEPTPYRTGTGPTGGGELPLSSGAPRGDPWGTAYGYCVWDVGPGACAVANRLSGTPDPTAGDLSTKVILAVVSAGPNGIFETTCAAYSNGTTPVFTTAAGSDDLRTTLTYEEAAKNPIAEHLWKLKPGDASVATTSKDLEIQGGAAQVTATTGAATFTAASIGGVTTATGGALTATSAALGAPCSATGLLRYDTASKELQVCTAAGAWKSLAPENHCGTAPGWINRTSFLCHSGPLLVTDSDGDGEGNWTPGRHFLFANYDAAGSRALFRAGEYTGTEWNASNTGEFSAALGLNTRATADRSFAVGASETGCAGSGLACSAPDANGNRCVALGGRGTSCTVGEAMVIGYSSIAKGTNTLAIGSGLSIDGPRGVGIGSNLTTSSDQSVAIGNGGVADNNRASVIGLGTAVATDGSETEELAILGPGASGSNAFVAINAAAATVGPLTYNLEVRGPGGTAGTAWKSSPGNWIDLSSDARMKDVVGPYKRGLAELAALHPVLFHYRDGNSLGLDPAPTNAGLVAQDVRRLFPEAVSSDGAGNLTLSLDPILLAMVNAAKDLHAANEDARRRLEAIRKTSP